jgi:hypothetical protein
MQGTSECFQVLAHKNRDGFDRRFSIGRPSLQASDRRATVDNVAAAE